MHFDASYIFPFLFFISHWLGPWRQIVYSDHIDIVFINTNTTLHYHFSTSSRHSVPSFEWTKGVSAKAVTTRKDTTRIHESSNNNRNNKQRTKEKEEDCVLLLLVVVALRCFLLEANVNSRLHCIMLHVNSWADGIEHYLNAKPREVHWILNQSSMKDHNSDSTMICKPKYTTYSKQWPL